MSKRGLSVDEVAAIVVIIGILTRIFSPFPMRHKRVLHAARRSACVSNLKQLGLALSLYASENKDRFPPLKKVLPVWWKNLLPMLWHLTAPCPK